MSIKHSISEKMEKTEVSLQKCAKNLDLIRGFDDPGVAPLLANFVLLNEMLELAQESLSSDKINSAELEQFEVIGDLEVQSKNLARITDLAVEDLLPARD